jgi:hypothetical protein
MLKPESIENSKGTLARSAPLWLLLAVLSVYLTATHYVKAYSDPYSWLSRAQDFIAGNLATCWAPVYPFFLALLLKTIGPAYVFLSNVPLLIIMAGLLYGVTTRAAEDTGIAPLAGVWAVGLLVFVNRFLLLQLANPYREALAFTLLLTAILLFLSFAPGRGLWRIALSALLIGLSVGVRETCVLILFPAVLWLVCNGTRSRDHRWFTALAVLVGVMILGLIPFLIQNYRHSGHLWLPSYAARKWLWMVSREPGARWDIPIPGMSLGNFSVTGRKIAGYFAGKYSWWGAFLFVTGLVASWRRRPVVTWFLLPALFINLLFYVFWHTKSWRFSFVAELLAAPIMALGAVVLVDALARGLRVPGERARTFVAWTTAVSVSLCLGLAAASQPPRLRAWQMREAGEFIRSRIESPFAFVGPAHLTQLLGWLTGTRPPDLPLGVDTAVLRSSNLDKALSIAAQRALPAVTNTHIYLAGEARPPLLRQWFELDPALALSAAPVPLEVYDVPVTDRLYHIRTWQTNAVERVIEWPSPYADSLLMIDCFRLWDYPGRTWCRLTAGGRILEEAVSNGLHFVVVPAGNGGKQALNVRIESDAPLPAHPVLRILPMNTEATIEFGSAAEGWYYPYLSSELLNVVPLKDDSCLLFDRGSIRLPKFADASREVFAEFKFEYIEPDQDRRPRPRLVARSGTASARALLPGPGRAGTLTVSLGNGAGTLAWSKVDLALQSSNAVVRNGNFSRFLKLYRARLYPFSWDPREEVAVDIGGGEDAPYLLEGFHESEKHEGRISVRWTSPRCRMRLPIGRDARVIAFTVRYVSIRPAARPADSRFVVDGWTVPQNAIEVARWDDGTEGFYFTVPASRLTGSGPVVFEMISNPWVPAETGAGPDHRELGLMLDMIEAAPAAFE